MLRLFYRIVTAAQSATRRLAPVSAPSDPNTLVRWGMMARHADSAMRSPASAPTVAHRYLTAGARLAFMPSDLTLLQPRCRTAHIG
jgi:hypothetical protein